MAKATFPIPPAPGAKSSVCFPGMAKATDTQWGIYCVSHGPGVVLGAGDSMVTRQSHCPEETQMSWDKMDDRHISNLEGNATLYRLVI